MSGTSPVQIASRFSMQSWYVPPSTAAPSPRQIVGSALHSRALELTDSGRVLSPQPRWIVPMIDMGTEHVNMVESGVSEFLTPRERKDMDTMLSREWGGKKATAVIEAKL